MATYKYTAWEYGYSTSTSYVKYNITPDYDSSATMTPLQSFTVKGQVYAKNYAIKKVVLYLLRSRKQGNTSYAIDRMGDSATIPPPLTSISVSVAKGATGTFTMTFVPGREFWERCRDAAAQWPGWDILFEPCFALNSELHAMDDSTYAPPTYSMRVMDRAAFALTASHTDTAAVSALTAFGGMATGHSKPRVSWTWAIDSNYPDVTCEHTLTLSGAMTGTYTAQTGIGGTSIPFDLPSPRASGTVNYVCNSVDTLGASAEVSGSFPIFAYTPPTVDDFTLERYAEVIESGGYVHEAADDGELVWLSLSAGITPVNGLNTWVATFTAWPSGMDEPTSIRGTAIIRGLDGGLSGLDDWDLSGDDSEPIYLLRDEEQLTGFTPSAGANWLARITIEDILGNSVTMVSSDITAADMILDVEPYGIGIGMRSRGSKNDIDPVTGDVTEIHQAVDIADDWMLRVRGPMSIADGQLMQVAAVSVPMSVASGSRSASVTVSAATLASELPDGFSPLGVVGVMAHSDYWYPYRFYINSSNELILALARYTGTVSSTTSLNNTVYVLCMRALIEDEQTPSMDDIFIVAHTLILGDTVDAEVSGTTLTIDDGRFNVSGTTLNIV